MVEKFLTILAFIVSEPGPAFRKFVPGTLSLCLESVFPLILQVCMYIVCTWNLVLLSGECLPSYTPGMYIIVYTWKPFPQSGECLHSYTPGMYIVCTWNPVPQSGECLPSHTPGMYIVCTWNPVPLSGECLPSHTPGMYIVCTWNPVLCLESVFPLILQFVPGILFSVWIVFSRYVYYISCISSYNLNAMPNLQRCKFIQAFN